MKVLSRRTVVYIGVICMTMMATILLIYKLTWAFDPAEWRAQARRHNPDNPRWGMRYAVKYHYLDRGMTREEVVALLGEPDYSKSPDVYAYELGAWSGMGIDWDTLDVHFDSGGRVVRVMISQR